MTHLRFKRHYRLLLLLALVAVVLVVGAGDQRIVAYSAQDIQQLPGLVITYGHALAARVDAAGESIGIPGAVQAAGVASPE
jgi:hypothetical protein